jgi:hypothetical protein
LQPLMFHHAILDARKSGLIAGRKKTLDPGIVPRSMIESVTKPEKRTHE